MVVGDEIKAACILKNNEPFLRVILIICIKGNDCYIRLPVVVEVTYPCLISAVQWVEPLLVKVILTVICIDIDPVIWFEDCGVVGVITAGIEYIGMPVVIKIIDFEGTGSPC